jgi:hypothetical protein
MIRYDELNKHEQEVFDRIDKILIKLNSDRSINKVIFLLFTKWIKII